MRFPSELKIKIPARWQLFFVCSLHLLQIDFSIPKNIPTFTLIFHNLRVVGHKVVHKMREFGHVSGMACMRML